MVPFPVLPGLTIRIHCPVQTAPFKRGEWKTGPQGHQVIKGLEKELGVIPMAVRSREQGSVEGKSPILSQVQAAPEASKPRQQEQCGRRGKKEPLESAS